MDNKKSSVMLVKFLISTLLALLVFYFLTSWACSNMPLLHDKAPKVMGNLNRLIDGFETSSSTSNILILELDKNKAFYFFEENSNQARVYSNDVLKGDLLYIINRDIANCHRNKSCFCYCDGFSQITYTDNCNLVLECDKHKQVCESFDLNFSFQRLGEYFFEKDENTKKIFFNGGFLVSPDFINLDLHAQRRPFRFHKPIGSDIIHLCSKTGDCLINDFSTDEELFLLQHSCHR